MDKENNFLIAKFGEREHLEQLQKGNIFFNVIQEYRNDGTNYRGDRMEGKIPIDPHSLKIYDEEGNNIFETIPYPSSVTMSLNGDEGILMFCAAIINETNTMQISENEWIFKEEFKSAIRSFGKYVLILKSEELLKHIQKSTDEKGQKIVYDSGAILYRDMEDFENMQEYKTTGSRYDSYFVKGLSYKNQNEWRVIIDGEKEPLKINCETGFMLYTYPLESSIIMETDRFLNGKIEMA